MSILYVGFTGTRHGMTHIQLAELRGFFAGLKAAVDSVNFHHGDCIGADAQAHDIARYLGFYIGVHPPTTDVVRAYRNGDYSFPPKAYLERNRDIVDAVSILIAAPAQPGEVLRSGTWATVRYARARGGKDIVMIPPGGGIR